MNIDQPVSSIMTVDLKTVEPEDSLADVKEIFDKYSVHHVPVTDSTKLVGIISQSDFNHFVAGRSRSRGDELLEAARLRAWTAGEVMTKDVISLEPTDTIRQALHLFKSNRFHALPVVEENKLTGILTTFDFLDILLEAPVES